MTTQNGRDARTATIRAVASDDWQRVRDVYLAMLDDSPHAFGERLDDTRARPQTEWAAFVGRCAQADVIAAYLAEDAEGVCGFVRGDTADPRTPRDTILVSQVWVAPRQRGTGLGFELMRAITEWAKGRGLPRIALGVAESNLVVRPFYERLGYRDTGMRVPFLANPAIQVLIMGRTLD